MSARKRFDNRAEGRERNFSELGSDLKINLKKEQKVVEEASLGAFSCVPAQSTQNVPDC